MIINGKSRLTGCGLNEYSVAFFFLEFFLFFKCFTLVSSVVVFRLFVLLFVYIIVQQWKKWRTTSRVR